MHDTAQALTFALLCAHRRCQQYLCQNEVGAGSQTTWQIVSANKNKPLGRLSRSVVLAHLCSTLTIFLR